MQVIETALAEVKIIAPRVFRDERGYFVETYSRAVYKQLAGIEVEFIQDNHSRSEETGVIRGLHFQAPPYAQGKLIRVVRGSVQDVVVDIRVGSPTFGRHASIILTAENQEQIWVPKGFAHGLCTLEPGTEVSYKVTDYYNPGADRGLAWDDPVLGIEWRVAPDAAILSDRDRNHPVLKDLPAYFQYEDA
jgi:dTDP-4-dehydrorhamnose 3,5-epimerase